MILNSFSQLITSIPSGFTLKSLHGQCSDHSGRSTQLLYSDSLTRTLHRTCSCERMPCGSQVTTLMLQTALTIALLVALQELASTGAPWLSNCNAKSREIFLAAFTMTDTVRGFQLSDEVRVCRQGLDKAATRGSMMRWKRGGHSARIIMAG